jgi:uncharacterized protein (UPF0128 family)
MLEAKQNLEAVNQELENALAAAITDERVKKKKPEGDVTFEYVGLKITSKIPKIIAWDTDKLMEIAADLENEGVNAEEFLQWKLSIPEAKYKVLPDAVRQLVDDARTLKHGKHKLEVSVAE